MTSSYENLNVELPPWPYLDAGPARVHVGGKRYVFGTLIAGQSRKSLTTVLVGSRVYQVPKEQVRVT